MPGRTNPFWKSSIDQAKPDVNTTTKKNSHAWIKSLPEAERLVSEASKLASKVTSKIGRESSGQKSEILAQNQQDSFFLGKESSGFISKGEMQACRETVKIATDEIERVIEQALPSKWKEMNVKAELNLNETELFVFKKNSQYFICKHPSVAEKHFGGGYIERVAFTEVDGLIKGGKYKLSVTGIEHSKLSAFENGGELRITSSEKLTEDKDWRSVSKSDLDLSKYFARPSKTDTKKAIIDFTDSSWEEYKKGVDDGKAREAFRQFLSDPNVGGKYMKKLLDDVSKLDEAYFDELSKDTNPSAKRYQEYNDYFEAYLQEFEEKIKLGKWDEKERNDLVESTEKSLINKGEILLEKGFELFKYNDKGKDINDICENRKRILYESSEEAQEAIHRDDYHYQDYLSIRNEFLTHHFKPKAGGINEEKDADMLINSMEKKLGKSLSVVRWGSSLENKDPKVDFELLKEDEPNKQFEQFLKSKEGISTKRLLAEIKHLERENAEDNEIYKKNIKEFEVHLKIFLNKYSSELAEKDKKAAINGLQGRLYSARRALYGKHFNNFLDDGYGEGKNTKELENEWQSLYDNPNLPQKLKDKVTLIDQARYLPARNELVRTFLELGPFDEKPQECIKEVKRALNEMNEIMRKGIEETKSPEEKMKEIAKKYDESLKNNDLHKKLEASLADVESTAKDEIVEFLQDIRYFHEKMPNEINNDMFINEYNKKIRSFVRSVDKFNRNDHNKEYNAKQVYYNSQSVRNFLSGKMFAIFASKYQGEDYVALSDIYSRYATTLSGGGWDNVSDATDASMKECHLGEFELLKSENEQKVRDLFSKMTKSAKENLEVAMEEAEEEVKRGSGNNKELKELLKDSREILDRIGVTV